MKYSESLKRTKISNIYIEREILRQQISGHVCTGKWDKSESIRNICKQKVGNSIVRHRLTRLIRESYRLQEERFRCGLDIIVIARIGAKGKDYKDIVGAMLHLGHLHKIIDEG